MATKKRSTSAKLSPLRDRILIKRIETNQALPGGVIIPDTAKQKLQEGEVVAAGSGKAEKRKGVPLDVKVGDRVLFGKYSGGAVLVDEVECLVLREDEILAKLFDETKPWEASIGAGTAPATRPKGEPVFPKPLSPIAPRSPIAPKSLETKSRQRAAAGKPIDLAAQAKAMEEEVEFSNVTNFRNSLLGAVEHLQGNPAKRYVITKRGEPEAVLMSYKTYSLMTRAMNQTLEKLAAQDRQEPVHAAFDRMRHEHPLEAPALAMSAAALDSPAYPASVTGGAATPANSAPDLSTLINEFQALRGHFDKLDDMFKQRERPAPPAAAKGEREKE